jgi:MATE family multidrug resistance protein
MFLSMLAAAAIFIVCYYVTMTGTASNHGLWISFLAYLLTRGVMQWLMYARDRKK